MGELIQNSDGHKCPAIPDIVFIETLKTFISVCFESEQNSTKLAKHGTKAILSGITLYSNKNNTNSMSLSSISTNHNYSGHNMEVIKYIAILFCNISQYQTVCDFLYNYKSTEIIYNVLLQHSDDAFICDQFISFLSNM